jgi:signal transduction histidine kinase
MWRRVVQWHRDWEDELFGMLANPGHAAVAQSGVRRRMAAKLAALTPIERRQLREFGEAHRGARGYWFLAKLLMLFSLAGVAWHVVVPDMGWGTTIGIANVVGIALLVATLEAWFNYRKIVRDWRRFLRQMAGFWGVIVLVDAAFKVWVDGVPVRVVLTSLPSHLGWVPVVAMLIWVPQLAVSLLRYRQYQMLAEQLQREAENERLARELAESKLRLLRAQIEPHFLFNTLGAVQQLAQHGAPRAAALTGDLIGFLRSSMRDIRSEHVGLAAEFGLVESYLKVMQVRLGARLRFELHLPRALEQVQIPSMIVLTLVENAIKHGIEPALRGGGIAVSAEALGGVVRIRVQDDGVGMGILSGAGEGGTGLDNVRHRLRLTYGDAAGLALRDGAPGLIADVTIPHPQP